MTPLSPDAACRVVPKRGLVRALQKLALCFILLRPTFCLGAQEQYTIDWFKISAGGGTSTNGQYSVTGTIGQHDAGGPMAGGNYSLTGGFWSLIAAVQTQGAPTLTITSTGPNMVVVSWPLSATDLVLQQNPDLRSATWSNYSGTINDDGTIKSVTISPPTGNLFFRLIHP